MMRVLVDYVEILSMGFVAIADCVLGLLFVWWGRVGLHIYSHLTHDNGNDNGDVRIVMELEGTNNSVDLIHLFTHSANWQLLQEFLSSSLNCFLAF